MQPGTVTRTAFIPQGSELIKVDTDPIVNGGSYVRTRPDGVVEEALIMGVERKTDNKGKVVVEGMLYILSRGPMPQRVVEGTQTLQGWALVAAPTKGAADFAKGVNQPKAKPVVPTKPGKPETSASV
jgi:hypothetical protein